MNDETMNEIECAYCGRAAPWSRLSKSAKVRDNAGWQERAPEHTHNCHWIATRGHQLEIPSDDRLRALQAEASAAGDFAQVELCGRALDGNAKAIALCALVLLDAEAQADEVTS